MLPDFATGATDFAGQSNECTLGGERVVIKSAAARNKLVGVAYLTLDRVAGVVGAFELDDGSFEVWRLSNDQFRAAMRDAAGSGAGRQAMVGRAAFERDGRSPGRVKP
jgi:hypothetical protein